MQHSASRTRLGMGSVFAICLENSINTRRLRLPSAEERNGRTKRRNHARKSAHPKVHVTIHCVNVQASSSTRSVKKRETTRIAPFRGRNLLRKMLICVDVWTHRPRKFSTASSKNEGTRTRDRRGVRKSLFIYSARKVRNRKLTFG